MNKPATIKRGRRRSVRQRATTALAWGPDNKKHSHKALATDSSPPATRQSTQALVESVVQSTLGTMVDTGAALMSAGLDSLSVAELVSTLSTELKLDVAPTDLFDHPTLDSMASYI